MVTDVDGEVGLEVVAQKTDDTRFRRSNNNNYQTSRFGGPKGRQRLGARSGRLSVRTELISLQGRLHRLTRGSSSVVRAVPVVLHRLSAAVEVASRSSMISL